MNRPTDGALTQFLIDVTRGARREAYAADRDGTVAAAPLPEGLRRAIRAEDVGALWCAGAHPMALLYFARGLGWDNARYYACLDAAEAAAAVTSAVPADAPTGAPPAPSRTRPPSDARGR